MKRFVNWKSALSVAAINFAVFADPILTYACTSSHGGC